MNRSMLILGALIFPPKLQFALHANMRLLHVTALLFMIHLGVSGSFLSWMFGSKGSTDSDGNESSGDGENLKHSTAASLGRVPFEMRSAEQRYLKAGEEYMAGLSVLDTCHHKVIGELEMSCNDITEEELGKLGVALLNCQSQAEGRPTFTCTKQMSLGECTSGMDATTWNTYHIISDRSRSVCYGVRQQQFQRQTRYAVNQLAATAEDQLYVMENLREGQDALHIAATDTLQIMTDGQKELMGKQQVFKESQGELQVSIESNLKDLSNEKALISSGHKELASMTDNIRQQLDNATKQLLSQDQDLKRNHQDLQRDLASIRVKASEVWDKLDGNMQHVSSYQDETSQYYQETIDNLKKMNDTINYLLDLINNMQTGIDERLGWLTAIIGGVGNNLSLLIIGVNHMIYFLLASLAVTFLHTPTFSRIVLLFLVPLNAISEVKHGASLDFSGLTILIIGVVLANWIILLILRFNKNHKFALTSKPNHQIPPSSPCRCNHVCPTFVLPPAVNRSLGGLSEFSDDEDYTIPTDLSEITGENTTFTYNSSMLSDPSMFHHDTTLTTGIGVTNLGLSTFVDHSSTNTKSDAQCTPVNSSTKTPMPLSSSSIQGFIGGNISQMSSNPAKRQILTSTLEELSRATPSPRSKREGTPNSSRPSTPGKRLCSGLTKTGQPCRLACSQGAQFCYRHTDNK